MKAILSREFKSYFTLPTGYIYLGLTLLLSGWFFVSINLRYTMTDMSYFFSNMTVIFLFLVPLLTMRLFAEEKRNKTDQILLTAPVTVTQIVLGKYFSALALFGASLLIMLIYPAVMLLFGNPMIGSILALYAGFFFTGAALISIGLFISSSTESQITAAIVSFVVMLLFQLTDLIASVFNNPVATRVINWFSVMKRYQEFTTGILSLSSVVYFISFCAVFVYLTVQSIERKRWS